MNNINIKEVVNIKELQTLQDSWAKATGLAFVTVDCNGVPVTRYSNFTPFCAKLRETEKYRERCYYCDACGGRKARRKGKSSIYVCHAGLVDFAIPIMIEGNYIGAILAGQVKAESIEGISTIMKISEDWKEDEELRDLYDQVTVNQADKIVAVAKLICDNYNYSIGKEYASKVEAELREKDMRIMKEEKLRIEMEKSLREIELKALHYQINPHFLFNVLNTIGRLAFFENAKMTEDVVYAFADMMRYNLRKSGMQLSSLEDEVTQVLNYLKIQKIRLGSGLQYHIDIPEEFYPTKVPFMTLPTIVENAIKHAVECSTTGGNLEIVGRQIKKNLVIEVTDSGKGMTRAEIDRVLKGEAYKQSKNGAVGIYNVNSRLMRHFGNEYGLEMKSIEDHIDGTKVIIKIPLDK